MFEYCRRKKRGIGVNIGEFLSHSVNWLGDEGDILPIELINEWDRVELATRFVDNKYFKPPYGDDYKMIGGIENKEKFIEEVAIKIDEFIPKRYFVEYHLLKNTYGAIGKGDIGKKFKGRDNHEETKNLVYKYSCNVDKEKEKGVFTYYVTDKQLKYLTYLAEESGYVVKNEDNLECSMASKLIAFLLGNIDEVENMFEYLEYE